jgi:signal transduction histidine kinase
MTDPNGGRPGGPPPVVGTPPPFVERRRSYRRAADRLAHRETTLLARSLDLLVRDEPAEARLARVLDLVARTAGARRAAVLAGANGERRVAVARTAAEDDAEPLALAAWLDAWAPRTRAQRAAAAPASVLVVAAGHEAGRADPPAAVSGDGATNEPTHHYACLPIPSTGEVALGFDFVTETAAARLDESLPPQLARHAAVVLSLVSDQVAAERDLTALRAREEERDRFVSMVAHELRTPLTGLAGYLELILGGQVRDPADQRDFLERSRQIVTGMTELVGDLLELSRIESAAVPLELGPFSPAEVVGRVADGLAPIALDRGVQLETTAPPRLRAGTGDRRRVEQVVTNLAANALKFAPSGSTVEIAAWFEGPVGLLAVRDEGRGIAPDDRERIFDRFYRMTGHERISGTGLGLPIARELTRAMGGDLGVASVPGSGSSFILALPGPTGVEPQTLAATLEAALQEEEVRLEERAVLRALAAAPRPHLVRVASGLEAAPQPAAASRPRLRALDGRASRNTDSSPA